MGSDLVAIQNPMQLYAISDRHLLLENKIAALISLAGTWVQHNIDYIQIREKDLAPSDLLELTQQIVAAVRADNSTTRVLLNGPAAIALEAGADGIHLPANSPTNNAKLARALFDRAGREATISHACHSLKEVLKTKEESQRNNQATTANTLILYAPVFEKIIVDETPLPGQGLDALKHAVEAAKPIPVFALGGVTLENAHSCIAAGASGIAGIRIFLR